MLAVYAPDDPALRTLPPKVDVHYEEVGSVPVNKVVRVILDRDTL